MTSFGVSLNMPQAMAKRAKKQGTPKAKRTAKVASATPAQRSTKHWLYLLPALVAALVVFGQTVGFDFVNWDDELNVIDNRGVTTFDLQAIWTETVIGNYNPLPITTFAIEHALVGLDASLYHATNLVLHLINIALVFFLGRRLRLEPVAAGILALLFAIHPMRVESVAWVTERKDVLFTAFYFAALLVYARRRQAGASGSWFWPVGGLFLLALVSKIQAVSLPLTMLCFDYLRQGKLSLRDGLAKAPYFLMSLLVGLAGLYFLGRDGSLDDATTYTFIDRLAVGAYAYAVYLIKAVMPYEMSPLYPYPAKLPWQAFASFGVVLATLGLLVVGYLRDWRNLVFGVALFSVNVVFMLQVLGAGQGYLADRFTYVGYLGLFWLMAFAIQQLVAQRSSARMAIYAGVGVYLLVLTTLSYRQTQIWQNGGTLWSHVSKLYPRAGTAHGNLGQYLAKQGDVQAAMLAYGKAIEVDPKSGAYHNSRGKLQFDQGNSTAAIADYSAGITREPELAELYINRGAAYAKTGRYPEAERDLDQGLTLDPENFNGLLNQSLLLYTTQRYDEALQVYDDMLRRRPERVDLLQERGAIKAAVGDIAGAQADMTAAIRQEQDPAVRARYQQTLDQLNLR